MDLEYVRPNMEDVDIFLKSIYENNKAFNWTRFFEFISKEYEGRCLLVYSERTVKEDVPNFQQLIYVEITITNSQSRFYRNLVGLKVNDFGSGDEQNRLVDAFCFVFSLIASEHFLFNKTWTFDQIKPEVTRLTKELLEQFVYKTLKLQRLGNKTKFI